MGGPCNKTCAPRLHHVFCDSSSSTCSCEKSYPVMIGYTKGCAKGTYIYKNSQIVFYILFPSTRAAKKLDEQCFYDQTCQHNDPNALCVQVRHNARCQCANGYHSVTYSRPTKRVFCTPGDTVFIFCENPQIILKTTLFKRHGRFNV